MRKGKEKTANKKRRSELFIWYTVYSVQKKAQQLWKQASMYTFRIYNLFFPPISGRHGVHY